MIKNFSRARLQTKISASVPREQMIMLNYEVDHVVVLGQNNLIISLKCYGRQVQSPTDTHQIIH